LMKLMILIRLGKKLLKRLANQYRKSKMLSHL
jgi:hypothetical protein